MRCFRFLLKPAVSQKIHTLKGVKSPFLIFFSKKSGLFHFLASILEYIRKQRYKQTTPPKNLLKF